MFRSACEVAGFGAAEAEAQGGHPVAAQAEGAEVREIAFAAALDDGDDVVSLPEGAAGVSDEIPVVEQALARGAAGAFQDALSDERVYTAAFANAAIAFEDLVAEVAGVRAEAPLLHAIIRAESTATFSHWSAMRMANNR